MPIADVAQSVELPSGRSFDPARSRWDGPLDAEELEYCRAHGIEVGYDPAQIGWVVAATAHTDDGTRRPDRTAGVHAEIEHAATELAAQGAGGGFDVASAIGAVETRLLADLDLHLADHLHWLLTHRVTAAIGDTHTPSATNRADVDSGVGFRAWAESDVHLHRELLDDEQVWEHLPESYPDPYTDETSMALIAVANARAGHDVVAVTIEGAVVGQCLLRIEPDSAGPTAGEVAYWLGRPFWGQGLMGRVLPRFVDRCFDAHGVDVLYAWIRPDNVASVRVAERVGFRRDTFVREAELARATGRAGFARWALHRH